MILAVACLAFSLTATAVAVYRIHRADKVERARRRNQPVRHWRDSERPRCPTSTQRTPQARRS